MKTASNTFASIASKRRTSLQPLYPLARLERDCDCEHCAVCRRVIASGKWFTRINYAGWRLALCDPLCAEVFDANPAAYVRHLEMLAWRRAQHVPRWAGAELCRL